MTLVDASEQSQRVADAAQDVADTQQHRRKDARRQTGGIAAVAVGRFPGACGA